MRISTHLFHTQGLQSIQNHQQSVLDAQLQLSTGKKINAPSDDPVGLSQVHALNRTLSTIDQFAKNGDYAKSQLEQEETAINDVIINVQRARELAIQMSNDTYNAGDRQATAKEVEQIIQQLYNQMNYTNSDGEKLFAGGSVNVEQAFIVDPNNPDYYAYVGSPNADNGNPATTVADPLANYGGRFVQIGFDGDNQLPPNDQGDPSRVRITDSGDKVFGIEGPNPYDYQGLGVDHNILNVLVEFKKALESGNPPPAGVIEDMDASIGQMTQVRAEIGGRQNRIEAQFDAGESFKVALEERRIKLEDADIVQGVTDLTQSQNALQLAQQVFSRVNGMSLFDYLR
ncbi:MAG: flagellar hook-associated protein FlgL [Thiotrichales bacterium]|nr:flagellar hook-associated protein FlgL [Thiotrichales bacterium]